MKSEAEETQNLEVMREDLNTSRSHTSDENATPTQLACFFQKLIGKDTTKDETNNTNNNSRSLWADLPIELVELQLPCLSLADRIGLRSVCKAWSCLSNTALEATTWPWLMYFDMNNYRTCRLFDPINNKEFSLDMEWLTGGEECTLHFSKDGWVLLSTFDRVWVANPFTRESLELPTPDHQFTDVCNIFSFYSLPNNDYFMVLGARGSYDYDIHHYILEEICYWWHGEPEWITRQAPSGGFSLQMSWTNGVIIDDEFNFLGRRGDLGSICPYDNDKVAWKIYETPVPTDIPEVDMKYYLLELDGQVISVFIERIKRDVRIFRLHDSAWDKQDDLGELTLFLNENGSVAKKLMLGKEYANRMYLAAFNVDKDCKIGAYYSCDTRSYNASFDNIKKPLWKSVWIEPNLKQLEYSEL